MGGERQAHDFHLGMSLFRSTNLFASVDCPQGTSCALGNCIFKHDDHSGGKRLLENVEDVPSKKQKQKREPVKEAPQVEPLVPQMLNSAPANLQQRLQFVKVLYDKLEEHKVTGSREKAISLEAEVAKKSTKFTYAMGIRSTVRSIVSGEYIRDSNQDETTSVAQILHNELNNLLVSLKELEERKYVLSPPTSEAISSDLVVSCERCRSTFSIKDPETKTSACRFHPLKRQWDFNTKKLSTIFPCCNESVTDSAGCETRDFHVYKLKEPSLMAGLIPYRETPAPITPEKIGLFAVGLDCEMGWTTMGFELIRVTLVDYDTSKIVMDRLVQPFGRILDLNTLFSGVKSMDHGTEIDGEKYPPLSFEEMYTELFKLITSSTIIVGHGLENDLNALRLVHHRIVDTAIIFPRVRSRTHSLKELAWMFLSRTIQTGQHDSMEDSLAAIDVVKSDIKQRCVQRKVRSFA